MNFVTGLLQTFVLAYLYTMRMDEDFVVEGLIHNGVVGFRRTAGLRIDQEKPVQNSPETLEQRRRRVRFHQKRIRREMGCAG